MPEESELTQSEFYMWRAVFAFALVDNVLSLEEQDILQSHLNTVPFNDIQRAILRRDFKSPQSIEAMYDKITRPEDQEHFCALARALVWCEGDMDKQEERILRHLSCLSEGAGAETLKSSREHPYLKTYTQHYAKANVAGLARASARVELRI